MGLTPKMALAMGLFSSGDCPHCPNKNISTSHYPICDYYLPLWLKIFKILRHDFTSENLKLVLRSGKDPTENVVFYGICTIYKAFVHILNGFTGNLDPLKHFRHMVYGRLLSEYHASSRGGPSFVENFHKKWSNFNLYIMKGHILDLKNKDLFL